MPFHGIQQRNHFAAVPHDPFISSNCEEGDDQLKTNLDGQLKTIQKYHRQKYLNTKSIINNINKRSCLEEKWELIIETNNDNIETCTEYKIDSKVARNEETESVGKTTLCQKRSAEKWTNFHDIHRNFHDSENGNNKDNRLLVKDINTENNNNEDNRRRINGSNIENGNNESTVKSNQGKLVFIVFQKILEGMNGITMAAWWTLLL